MGKKKTDEQFKEEVKELVGDEFVVLGEYVNSKTDIEFLHATCGNKFEMRPNSFLSGQRCKYCKADKMRLSQKAFEQKIFNLVGDEYTVVGKYIGAKDHVQLKHNVCGHVYPVKPEKFYFGRRCAKCGGTLKKTDEEFKKEVFDLVGDEYTFLERYINSKTPINIRHNTCGKDYPVAPSNFLSGYRCKYCFGNLKKTTEQFKEEVKDLVGDKYTVLGEYVNSKTDINIRHNEGCNHVFPMPPSAFLFGQRCPKCNFSKGELKINNLFEKHNIDFQNQFRFKDCRDKYPLPFDLAVINDNNIAFLVEFDGIQHFKAVEQWGGKDALKETKRRDNIKDRYCREHNIDLIRIPYFKKDKLENIILKKLYRYNLI